MMMVAKELHSHTHHVVTPGIVDWPGWSGRTAGQIDGKVDWWTTSGNIGLPPLARVKGVGTQQQHVLIVELKDVDCIQFLVNLQQLGWLDGWVSMRSIDG